MYCYTASTLVLSCFWLQLIYICLSCCIQNCRTTSCFDEFTTFELLVNSVTNFYNILQSHRTVIMLGHEWDTSSYLFLIYERWHLPPRLQSKDGNMNLYCIWWVWLCVKRRDKFMRNITRVSDWSVWLPLLFCIWYRNMKV